MAAIVPVLFFVLLAFGAPIFVVLGLTASLGFSLNGLSLVPFAQKVIDQLNSPMLLSIPFFVMAATYMEKGGIAHALVEMAGAWLGWLRGSLGIVAIVACVIFAAICGSSVATCIAMGTILIPAMTARGYDRPFALGLIGASGTLGILIPPSLPLILYAVIADESVPRLFLAGVVPGLLVALVFAGWVVFRAHRRGLPKGDPLTIDNVVGKTVHALPALSIPLIIAVGIYGGYVTVSEAAAMSAGVALLVSLGYYRTIAMRDVIPVTAQAVGSAAVITIIVAVALAFGHWITESGVPAAMVRVIGDAGLQSWQFLLLINLVMFIMGMFLEVASILLITLPILLPVLPALGIDPIHFAIILTINMEIAMITPPVGLNLFVLTGISGAQISETIRGVSPFVVLLIIMLLLITFVPQLSLWLPTTVYG
ncbi:TRAP transporter large permease subunit [Hoeflea sp. WL0058]|uniref:TRAP transporter large permease protein n=1 Tax=Flavimaribacter sediminis TaxID=2865987 RepID=A0AAE3D2Y8_9HYPH|nr:TRAP transporter large permease subunit [Flavimaribacter sediminis]MBW8639053.1 TRAP transporter large permease subunit [Flavimaribacter sediminis]